MRKVSMILMSIFVLLIGAGYVAGEKGVPHQVTLTMQFNDEGELQWVKAVPPANDKLIGKPGDPIPVEVFIKDKYKHKKYRMNTFLYGFGSPGSIIIQTAAGTVVIWWPQ